MEGLVEEANNHCSCNRGLLNSISEQTQHLQPGSSQTFLHLGPSNGNEYKQKDVTWDWEENEK